MAREPDTGSGILFAWASGFGLGALVVTIFMIFVIQIGGIGHSPLPSPSAATQPGQPAQNTGAQPAQQQQPAQAPQPAQPGQATAPTPQPQTTGRNPAPAR